MLSTGNVMGTLREAIKAPNKKKRAFDGAIHTKRSLPKPRKMKYTANVHDKNIHSRRYY